MRTILHIDMNAFFASVEQTANPFIRNKPIGVGNPNYDNSALVAVSYEAKATGVPKLSRAREAKRICPELIVVPFDPLKYYAVNKQIVKILKEYTPQVEVYSIDEAFLDMTDVLHLYPQGIAAVAQELKDRITNEVGCKLTSSVGIAPNKLLAKVASNWQKPDGLTTIDWDTRYTYLDKLPIEDVWGIGYRSSRKLTAVGINSTKQLRELTDNDLRQMVGGYYSRLKMLANGEHHDPVSPDRTKRPHKSMQHAHTMSHATHDLTTLEKLVRKLSEKIARRLRKHDQTAKVVYLGLKPAAQAEFGWGSPTRFNAFTPLDIPSNHGQDIYNAAKQLLHDFNIGRTDIRLAAVGVHELAPTSQQLLTIFTNSNHTSLDIAIDDINDTYGDFTVRSGDLLHHGVKESELHVDREDMTFHPAGGGQSGA